MVSVLLTEVIGRPDDLWMISIFGILAQAKISKQRVAVAVKGNNGPRTVGKNPAVFVAAQVAR